MLRQPERKLHLGCGSRRFPGWLNLDMNWKGDMTLDLREGLPFRDGSVELIYSEHSFEHFYREHDLPFLLGEGLSGLDDEERSFETLYREATSGQAGWCRMTQLLVGSAHP